MEPAMHPREVSALLFFWQHVDGAVLGEVRGSLWHSKRPILQREVHMRRLHNVWKANCERDL